MLSCPLQLSLCVCSLFWEHQLLSPNIFKVHYILFSVVSTWRMVNFGSRIILMLLLKNKQHSSFFPIHHYTNQTHKTHWNPSKLFVQTDVSILRTYKILSCECYQNTRKNLWSTKYVRRAIFRMVEYIFILQYFQKISSTGSMYQKRNILEWRIFFYFTLFSKINLKKKKFQETSEKLFWWHIWPFFRERRHLAPKINITYFTTN